VHADLPFGAQTQSLRRDLREAVQHDLTNLVHRMQLRRLFRRSHLEAVTFPPDTRSLREHMQCRE
jgi:hypothetical protein